MRQVLLLSRRSFDRRMYQSFFYELEDVIAEVERARIAAPREQEPAAWARLETRVRNGLRRWTGFIPDDDPRVGAEALDQTYDLFFYTCQRPHQLSFLRKLPEWKKRSRILACYLTEIRANEFDQFHIELKALGQFDHIFLNDASLVMRIQRLTGRPCHYLPIAVDAVRFSWRQEQGPSRRIDCYSMGRRNERIHHALLRHSQESDFFYLHDTARFFDFTSHVEHREMLASILRRSRYTTCERREDGNTLLPRMFESAAAGAVMLGEPPDTEEFRANLDWSDAMIPVPDPARVARQIEDLDGQPERLAALRATGAAQVLQRHDWVHRWKSVLRVVGLEDSPGVRHREDKLLSIAARIVEPAGLFGKEKR